MEGSTSPLHDAAIFFGCILTFASVAVFAWAMTPLIRITFGFTPKIVKERTQNSIEPSIISSAIDALAYYFVPLKSNGNASPSIEEAFEHIVLPEETKGRVLDLARIASNARRNNTRFQHAVFHGPDGAGKLAAKRLAKFVGIDYAYVCGQEIRGEDAVSHIQTLFYWAKNSSDGILLFIDEPEAILRPTNSLMNDDTNANNALSSFVYNSTTNS